MQANFTKLLSIIIVIVIIIACILGIVLYMFTDLFKSSEGLFKKYISQNISEIYEIFDISTEEKIISLLSNESYTQNISGNINYSKNEDDSQEEYKIEGKAIVNNLENKSYLELSSKYQNEELLKTQILQEDNLFGLRLVNIVNKFVSVENKDLQYFISGLGYDGTYINNKLNKVILNDIISFTDEEKSTLEKELFDEVFKNIDENNYSSKESIITLANGESVTTNSYSMSITQNELDKVYKRVINNLISNEIILKKLDLLDNKILELGIINNQTVKQAYINKMQEFLDSLEYKGFDDTKTVISVYVVNGKTISIRIDKQDFGKIFLDVDTNETNTYNLSVIKYTETGSETQKFTFSKEMINNGFIKNIEYEDENKKCKVNYQIEQENDKLNIKLLLENKNENVNDLVFNISSEILIGNEEEIAEKYTNANNIILNNYDADSVLTSLKSLKNIVKRVIQNKQEKLNTKMLKEILNWVEEQEKYQEEQEKNNLELRKKRFNNKFEIYEGENLDSEQIKKLLKVVSYNFSGFEKSTGGVVKLLIENGKTNEPSINQLIDVVSNKNRTYNIKIGYSDEGFVNAIYLSVYQK